MTDNELIARFMAIHVAMHGLVLYRSDEDGYIDFAGGAEPYCPDRRWNDLMPVVHKIKKDQHNPNEMFMGTTVDRHLQYSRVTDLPISLPIQIVYDRVVEFIKWYNEQTKWKVK